MLAQTNGWVAIITAIGSSLVAVVTAVGGVVFLHAKIKTMTKDVTRTMDGLPCVIKGDSFVCARERETGKPKPPDPPKR